MANFSGSKAIASGGVMRWAARILLSLMLSATAAAFARQSGAVDIVTSDPPSVTETQTTPVPVPYAWLDAHVPGVAHEYEAYEAAAKSTAENGRKVWECYVVGLDLSNPLDDFRITRFWMDGYKPMFEFSHTLDGSGNSFLPYIKTLGKANLVDKWQHVPDGGNPAFRFFAVEVVPPGCESVVAEEALGGVQLWENGPYWAECNIGATTPEGYGYHFWWGDTVGYTNTGSRWISVIDGKSSISFSPTDKTATMTYDMKYEELISKGYIDSTGSLVAAYDAATAHLGAPWRMPTKDEMAKLISECTSTWVTTNGVTGRLITGKGDYADRSIFLPAAGNAWDSHSYGGPSNGYYWSSTPCPDESSQAFQANYLYFYDAHITMDTIARYYGCTIRPVRDAQ